ncbi:unnamed protein product [Schistosoma margrebowiei]|uniref:Uncharacterized protein n=1 Tax=Schistosoma margrebowiei TaxID=48269 RepID=A0A183LDH4_9TREM|nr:unnamed protein product [Schistosoma margrebowiei]
MDSKFKLMDDDKENNNELSLDVEQAIRSSSIMSKAPIVQFLNKSHGSLCKKHEIQTSGSYTSKGKSFVEILGESSEYVLGSPLSNCPRDQITVRTPIDVLHLLHSKSEAPSNTADSDISLLPESYWKYFLIHDKYFDCSSESVNQENFTIFGLDKIRVRCCSCPTRDAKFDHKLSTNTLGSCSTGISSRRLSLCLSDHSNIRINTGISSARNSCPSKIQRVENEDCQESYSSIIFNGRKYFITMVSLIEFICFFFTTMFQNHKVIQSGPLSSILAPCLADEHLIYAANETDDPEVKSANTTLRDLSALTSEKWTSSHSRNRALKRIKKFYRNLESYVTDWLVFFLPKS